MHSRWSRKNNARISFRMSNVSMSSCPRMSLDHNLQRNACVWLHVVGHHKRSSDVTHVNEAAREKNDNVFI